MGTFSCSATTVAVDVQKMKAGIKYAVTTLPPTFQANEGTWRITDSVFPYHVPKSYPSHSVYSFPSLGLNGERMSVISLNRVVPLPRYIGSLCSIAGRHF